MSRVLILGAQGQLGIELQKAFQGGDEVVALGRGWCDLVNPESIRKAIVEVSPAIVLNAAAYTAVDRAESEPELAMRVNGEAPGVLAEEARKIGALLVHYSTDYVFDGSKMGPWVEDDAVNPLNTYGRTKLAGEQKIAAAGGRYLIFRCQLPDRPGALATLLAEVAELGANVLDVSHERVAPRLLVDEAEVLLQVETRGASHCDAVIAGLRRAGYTLKFI